MFVSKDTASKTANVSTVAPVPKSTPSIISVNALPHTTSSMEFAEPVPLVASMTPTPKPAKYRALPTVNTMLPRKNASVSVDITWTGLQISVLEGALRVKATKTESANVPTLATSCTKDSAYPH